MLTTILSYISGGLGAAGLITAIIYVIRWANTRGEAADLRARLMLAQATIADLQRDLAASLENLRQVSGEAAAKLAGRDTRIKNLEDILHATPGAAVDDLRGMLSRPASGPGAGAAAAVPGGPTPGAGPAK